MFAADPEIPVRHIRDCAQILRPGGTFLILYFSYHGDEADLLMVEDMPKGSADSVRGLVRDFGREGAVAHMFQQLRSTPGGPEMPDPVLRELCQVMVAKAMDGRRSGQPATARRSRF
jgi:hypothetical protein